MLAIGIFEAKNKFSTLLDRVGQGEEIHITRYRKAVARLIPVAPRFDRNTARQAADNLIEAIRGITLGGLKIKDIVNLGRP